MKKDYPTSIAPLSYQYSCLKKQVIDEYRTQGISWIQDLCPKPLMAAAREEGLSYSGLNGSGIDSGGAIHFLPAPPDSKNHGVCAVSLVK